MIRGVEDFDGVFAFRVETTWDDQHVQKLAAIPMALFQSVPYRWSTQ